VGLLMSISAGTRAVEQKESEAKAAGMALA
jgi:hypothetical protein